MRRLLLPLVMAALGLALGAGVALAMRWAGSSPSQTTCPAPDDAVVAAPDAPVVKPSAALDFAYVRLNNQFIVPVTREGRIKALVVLSISLEVAPEATEAVFAREPKLRDAFLRVLFDHANTGGFDGEFTANGALLPLREALREAGGRILGKALNDVLITEIARQDN